MTAPAPPAPPPLRTVLRPGFPVDLRVALGSLKRGARDPHMRFDGAAVWRACTTPDGPGTVHLAPRPGGEIDVSAWGPGAEWLLASAPGLVGARDDPDGFEPRHPLVHETARRLPHLRLARTGLVFDALVPAVLEQKVTGAEAWRSWRELVWRFGAPAPGPARLRVPPTAAALRSMASWDWHLAGVDGKRSRTIAAAALSAARVDETAGLPGEEARRRLRSLPGVGVWTAAEVAQRALGDADAVSVGDYHLAAFVGWALAGRPVDDDGMLELLEPYRPHRYRAVRLLELSGFRKPRFGPRMPVIDARGI